MGAQELSCRAILFDCDGVLVDSRSSAESAWTSWARTLDLDPVSVLKGLHGRRSQDTVALHVPGQGRPAALTLIEGLELATAKWARPILGGVELYTKVHDRSALVTSASRSLATARLQAAGYPRPAVMVSGADVREGKPSPEGYLRAADQLKVPIEACVVLEDSTAGVQAGRAAGAAGVIVIGNAVRPQDGEMSVADLRSLRWTGHSLVIAQPQRTE